MQLVADAVRCLVENHYSAETEVVEAYTVLRRMTSRPDDAARDVSFPMRVLN